MRMKQESGRAAAHRKGWKIAAIGSAAVVVIGGGVGIATASPWDDAASSAPSPSQSPAPSTAEPDPRASADATATQPPPVDVAVGVTPTDRAYAVNPATVAAVRVEGATLDAVELAPSAGGTPVEGTISADGTTWTASDRLAFDTEYTFSYTVLDSAGQP